MSTDTPTVEVDKESLAQTEQEDRASARATKATDVVKGVAVAYVGLKLGIAAIRFIGRRLRGRKGPSAGAAKPQRQQSASAAAPVKQQFAAAGEDSWAVVDAPPPAAPEGYRPIATAVLSCSPQELYSILFSSSGTDLYLKQHREIGKQWDLVATPWRHAPAAGGDRAPVGGAAADGSLLGPQSVFEYVLGQPGSGGFTRLLTFWNPKKPPSSNDTRCVQRQQLCAYRGGVLVFATAMNMLDIPFKDCFTVNSLWRAEPGPQPGTTALTVNLKVNFIKRAMGVGGIISATTFRDSTAFHTAFLASVEAAIIGLRQRTGAPLPAPLPAGVNPAGAGVGSQGPRLPRSASRRQPPPVSPFAAVAGAALPAGAQQQQSLPAWKQFRALVVFAVLAFTLLHQLHLGRELAAIRGDAATAVGAGTAGAQPGGSVGGLAAGLLASALGPLVSAAGSAHWVLQGLADRVAGRAPMPQ
ncbi:hypothetical protein PLESTB_000327600 [Pleodorina starrii]|uniref:VASt domain-containing protein n=1 Tax=Pleodorina starrii TaxID=330485 RepID=A0A9W6EYW6_9CHLO|nr:hypothetical protein PLESTB_000327600 [Pleodorina starrii]GLC75090.1 hypothetical protein PLESTF_001592800 [Pleodorina starrii]